MESYSIRNIKAFEKNTQVELKPLTILVGKNSCGKSSLLRFPVVLSQTFGADTTSPLKLYGKLIDYGSYEDVVFKNKRDAIEFCLKYKMSFEDVRTSYSSYNRRINSFKPHDVEIRVLLNKARKKVLIEKNELYIDDVLCYGLYREERNYYRVNVFRKYNQETDEFEQNSYDLYVKSEDTEEFFVLIDENNITNNIYSRYFPEGIPELERIAELKDGLPSLYHLNYLYHSYSLNREDDKHSYSKQLKEYFRIYSCFVFYDSLLSNIRRVCSYEMNYLSYIGPFRINPERIYRDEEFQTRRVGVKGENVSTVLIRDYQGNRELVKKISAWLNKTMGYDLSLEAVSNGLYRIVLKDNNGIKSNLIDVGYGISQILPIVAQILVESPKRTYFGCVADNFVLIEQPELHLHPAAQSELADLFVSGAIEGKKKLLIETHSEHFIRKLQVLVADPECSITNKDVAVYYVDKENDGSACIHELKMLPNGRFAERWPSGFFDKAHELSMELLKNSNM